MPWENWFGLEKFIPLNGSDLISNLRILTQFYLPYQTGYSMKESGGNVEISLPGSLATNWNIHA